MSKKQQRKSVDPSATLTIPSSCLATLRCKRRNGTSDVSRS